MEKNSKKFYFDEELIEGIIIKRTSQYVMIVEIDGEEFNCHCPTTERIADIDVKNIPCLLSESKNPKRKTPYTVEAICLDDKNTFSKNWIGINQTFSNKLVEFFLKTHQLDNIVSNFSKIKREQFLGKAKIDFLVDNTYIEVKTPLYILQVKYGKFIKTKKGAPFSFSERFAKHLNELTSSLEKNERAIFLFVCQYKITEPKPFENTLYYLDVKDIVEEAKEKGLESYQITMKFEKDGVELLTSEKIF